MAYRKQVIGREYRFLLPSSKLGALDVDGSPMQRAHAFLLGTFSGYTISSSKKPGTSATG